MFTLDVHSEPDHLLLRVSGELDLHTKQLFRDRLTALMQQSRQTIIIDLSDLEFIDSSGLGALLSIVRVPEASRPRIVLSQPGGPVRRLLHTTRLDLLLGIHSSVKAALTAPSATGSTA